jgi:large subunit ribosomal protein L2
MTTLPGAPVRPGATKALLDLPAGTAVHNVELRPGRGGVLCRSAGASATLVKNGDDGLSLIALPSGASSVPATRIAASR